MNLVGTDALVTGANRGLGKSLVRALADAGAAHIYASSRSRFQLPDLGTQTRVMPLKLDVTQKGQIKDAAIEAKNTRLLINNAGVLPRGGAMSISEQDVMAAFEVNLLGMWQMARSFAPIIAANGGGVIVNILSLISLQNAPFFAAYSASKHAAWAMTQSLQNDLAGSGVDVIACFPGGIDTDMLNGVNAAKAAPDDVADAIIDGIKLEQSKIFPDQVSSHMGPILLSGH